MSLEDVLRVFVLFANGVLLVKLDNARLSRITFLIIGIHTNHEGSTEATSKLLCVESLKHLGNHGFVNVFVRVVTEDPAKVTHALKHTQNSNQNVQRHLA